MQQIAPINYLSRVFNEVRRYEVTREISFSWGSIPVGTAVSGVPVMLLNLPAVAFLYSGFYVTVSRHDLNLL